MTLIKWEALLDRTPGDADLRLAYATWLQDEQEDYRRAAFQRWLAEARKWPTNEPLNREETGWAWYWSQEPVTEPAREATLGPWALRFMPLTRWLFATRAAAEEVAFKAWTAWQAELCKAEGR